MHAAALGLTCRHAMQVFAQNETLSLQAQLIEAKAKLARYEPNITMSDVNPNALLHKIKEAFDTQYPPCRRVAPVCTLQDAWNPLSPLELDNIWGHMGVFDDDPDVVQDIPGGSRSLFGMMQTELITAFGAACREFCIEQAGLALCAVRQALVGGYMASSGWDKFRLGTTQEPIVWRAIFCHLLDMKRNLKNFGDSENPFEGNHLVWA